jgi:predicted nucleotidyltransferase
MKNSIFSNLVDVHSILNKMKERKIDPSRIAFIVLSGSHAYGTYTSSSDIDIRGVFFNPVSLKKQETIEIKSEDITMHSIEKFLSLATQNNPNILELLYSPEQCVFYVHPLFKPVLEKKHLFLSKRMQASFLGYAADQLHRMKNHRKWIENPPIKPERKKYGLPETPLWSKEKIKALASMGKDFLDSAIPNMSETIFMELEYMEAYKIWKKYSDWIENRNPARSELEIKYHYDCKHAMHLLRLMKMAKEASQGFINVERPDKNFLISVRNGNFKYDEIILMADNMKKNIEKLFFESKLPDRPDFESIDKLYSEIMMKYFDFLNHF